MKVIKKVYKNKLQIFFIFKFPNNLWFYFSYFFGQFGAVSHESDMKEKKKR